ncbi:MAG: MotA/TolQ/ExbB proton channel family protein [Henriciella sp.]|nr:MotA/TolQ/ExbB proton channel family protein [Henriciella sp.]
MKVFTKSLKVFGVAAAFAGSTFAFTAPALAQSSLSEILRKVESNSRELAAEDAQRLAQFRRDTASQRTEMESAQAALAQANRRANSLSSQFDTNKSQIETLGAQLSAEAGEFGQLVGEFNGAVGDVLPDIENSLASFEYTGRMDGLAEVAQSIALPSREELDRLPNAILKEMIAQSEVKSFVGEVKGAGPDGETQELEMTRIGVFTIATNDGTRFVEFRDNAADGVPYLAVLKKQPTGRFRSQMASLISADEGTTVTVPFDPQKGALFAIEGEKPSLGERINQGGIVGYVILTLLVIGSIFALFKIVTLFLMGGAMRGSAKTKQAGDGNPLARVFETYETNKNADLETLELKLDEQILRESPKIERFNDIVKVLAAVAPLLGLLGTVIGMIITFTAITNFGAGDPKLMAGGISTALMTTVLGLVAAIPLLLLHAVSASMARGNQQVLDEQAAGLVALRAERESGGAA